MRNNSYIRSVLRARQGDVCAICKQVFIRASGKVAKKAWRPTLDHILPKAHGGTDELDNLQLSHAICNEYRGCGEDFKNLAVLERAKKTSECVVYLIRDRLQRQRMRDRRSLSFTSRLFG